MWTPPPAPVQRRLAGVLALALAGFSAGLAPALAQGRNTANTLELDDAAARPRATIEALDYVSFPLVELRDREVYFSGATYRRTSDTELRAYVAVQQSGGELEEIEFIFSRASF